MNIEEFEKAKKLGFVIAYTKGILNFVFDSIIISLAAAYVNNVIFVLFLFFVLLWRALKTIKRDYKGEIELKARNEFKKIFEVDKK